MRITLSVLLATLTIYCNSSVLSLPPSLIATAASTQQRHANQIRNKRGAVANAAGAVNAGTDPTPTPPPNNRETVRSKKAATFRLNGENIAPNGYNKKNANTKSDDIMRLPSYKLNSNAAYQILHPNNEVLAAAMDAHERQEVGIGDDEDDDDHLNEMTLYKRKLPSDNDLNALLVNAAERLGVERTTQQRLQPTTMQHAIDATPQLHAVLMKKFFTPLRYWTHHCQTPDHNCLQEYYRTLHTNSKAAVETTNQMDDFTDGAHAAANLEDANNDDEDDVNMKTHTFAFGGDHNDDGEGDGGGYLFGKFNDDAAIDSLYNNAADTVNNDRDGVGDVRAVYNVNEDNNASNDILMLLSGEQDVMKFLSWAMSHLYPYKHFANLSGDSAEYYHPGIYNWKKLNLSGRLEPPILVEEPHYVIVRREQFEEDMKPGDTQYKGDPFIPPRGRKHHLPDLDALLNRYETFVPNRGKRDKIKDIFKYDDLFFPNRGKKQMAFNSAKSQLDCDQEAGAVCGGDTFGTGERISKQVDESVDSELTAPPAIIDMRRMFGALKKRLQIQKRYMSWPRSADDERRNKGGASLRINLNRNSDDNLSNNYVDTIDRNIVGVGAGRSDDSIDDAAAWLPDIDDNAFLLTSSPTNERAQSIKSSIPQIYTASDTFNDNADQIAMSARMRHMPRAYGEAFRVAANRLRLTTPMSARQQKQRAALEQFRYNQHVHAKQQNNAQQNSKGIWRYFDRYMKRVPMQAQRRATTLLAMPANEVRQNSIDRLDRLPLRQLQQIQTKEEQKDFVDNKPLTVAHLPWTWLQHMSMQRGQQQQPFFGGIDGVAAGRNSPETANIERI